jgi:AcrR family transcriptional regulator
MPYDTIRRGSSRIQQEASISRSTNLPVATGRPRSEKSREAILTATNELLDEVGFDKLSIEGIAARAGVGKATIYRWWSTKGTLAIEAFLDAVAPQIAFPESQSAIADLKTQLPKVAQIYRGKTGRVLREIIALGQSDPETKRLFVEGYLEPRRSAAKEVLRRGVAQGEFGEGLDLDAVVDALYGPIFHRMLTGHAPLSDAFVAALVEIVLDGVTLKASRRRPAR